MALLFQGSDHYPGKKYRPVATIGNFDGLHLGHRKLVEHLLKRAQELEAPSLIYTFDPPPRLVLQPREAPPRISTLDEKIEGLSEMGVGHIVVETFTTRFGARPAEWFVEEVLSQRLRPQALVVGYDFRYGRGRAGNATSLRAQLPDLPVETVEALQLENGCVVASSRIREAVAEGRMHDASQLLGRPHRLVGVVVQGDRRGRSLGFPTANLVTSAELIPAPGVYAVLCGDRAGVANLGVRPTFDGKRFVIEVHLFDFEGDLYGQKLVVDFISRIRPERRFPNSAALAAQIRQDAAEARQLLVP